MNLKTFNKPVPRYTSYPTAPHWEPFSSLEYASLLETSGEEPLSLYIHIPFCASMCLFCGCSVILNRKPENEEKYLSFLCQEIALVASHLKGKKRVRELHIGGGTPTKLSEPLLQRLVDTLHSYFILEGEIAIEVDPRTVYQDNGKKLRFLKELGFNRISLGVQDTDPAVQEAIKRRQNEEVTRRTFQLAKECGFQEINLDLIYGLPKQTKETFQKTTAVVIDLKPDRIALFSYAKVPWLKPHQNAIKEEDLPSLEEKFAIYNQARKDFIEAGYVAIGMDHFALQESELAKSYQTKTLHRNFQGYAIKNTPILLGLGVTAIGYTADSYTQNEKELTSYYERLGKGLLPVARGKKLSEDDKRRKWVIHKLMCTFEVDKEEFYSRFGVSFDVYFNSVRLEEVASLVVNEKKRLIVTKQGELLVRNIAACFDAYQGLKEGKFSRAI